MSINVQVRVGVEWVNHFHADACQQAELSYCDDQVVGFYDHMNWYGHIQVFNWGNDNAWETDFRHPDFGGDSLNWSDDVHFCMVNDHGGNSDNIVSFYFSKAHTNCSVSSTKMRLGRKNLKWLAALGCDAVLNTNADHIVAVWGGPMQGAHIVCGYIGTAADSWWTKDVGKDFADFIGGDGYTIAHSWLSSAHSFWTGDAPIAIAAGVTRDDAINRRDHETLNWRDWNIAATNWLAWKYRT
jgi:uncharacterized protein DUF6345